MFDKWNDSKKHQIFGDFSRRCRRRHNGLCAVELVTAVVFLKVYKNTIFKLTPHKNTAINVEYSSVFMQMVLSLVFVFFFVEKYFNN